MSLFDTIDMKNMREAAAAAKAKPIPFLKFEMGTWTIGGTNVTDYEMLALPDLAMTGWKRFEDKQVVEERMVLAMEHGSPPRPDTFTDRSKWKTGSGGWPLDPWSKQLVLPLLNDRTGKLATFNASTIAGRIAVGDILDDFAVNRRRQIVVLTSELVRIDGRDVHEPRLLIVRHSENDAAIEGFTTDKAGAAPSGAKPKTDMNDDIPF